MCGPIATLSSQKDLASAAPGILVYNTGRIAGYMLLGALFGFAGYALGSATGIAKWSFVLRVGAGILLVLVGLQLLFPAVRLNPLDHVGSRFWSKISPLAMRLQSSSRLSRRFLLGVLWGWLPCGLVYSMLALAAMAGNAANGAVVMAGFGLGTLPSMLGAGLAASSVAKLRHGWPRPLMGLLVVVSGLWIAAMPISHMIGDHDSSTQGHAAHSGHHSQH